MDFLGHSIESNDHKLDLVMHPPVQHNQRCSTHQYRPHLSIERNFDASSDYSVRMKMTMKFRMELRLKKKKEQITFDK